MPTAHEVLKATVRCHILIDKKWQGARVDEFAPSIMRGSMLLKYFCAKRICETHQDIRNTQISQCVYVYTLIKAWFLFVKILSAAPISPIPLAESQPICSSPRTLKRLPTNRIESGWFWTRRAFDICMKIQCVSKSKEHT